MAEKYIDVAMESTSQEIKTAVETANDNVDSVVTNTKTNNTASPTGTLSQKLSYLISTLIGATGDTGGTTSAGTVMGKLNAIITSATNIYGKVDTEVAAIKTKTDTIGTTSDTGGSATAGTAMGKLNALLTSWTSTRAGYIDRLANSTYGLDKIKSAVDTVDGVCDKIYAKVDTEVASILSKLNEMGVEEYEIVGGQMTRNATFKINGCGTFFWKCQSGAISQIVIDGYALDTYGSMAVAATNRIEFYKSLSLYVTNNYDTNYYVAYLKK